MLPFRPLPPPFAGDGNAKGTDSKTSRLGRLRFRGAPPCPSRLPRFCKTDYFTRRRTFTLATFGFWVLVAVDVWSRATGRPQVASEPCRGFRGTDFRPLLEPFETRRCGAAVGGQGERALHALRARLPFLRTFWRLLGLLSRCQTFGGMAVQNGGERTEARSLAVVF